VALERRMGSANIWVGWTPNGIAEGVYSSTKKESGLRVRPVLARDPPGAPQCIPERVHPPQPFPRYGPRPTNTGGIDSFAESPAAAGRAWKSYSRQSQ
jgi:hypothetical protein